MRLMVPYATVYRGIGALAALLVVGGCGPFVRTLAAPSVVEAVAPSYPFKASFSGTSGKVVVDVDVATSGKPTAVHVVEAHSNMGANLNAILGAAARTAAEQWRFQPMARQMRVRLTFVFRIIPNGTSDDEVTTRFVHPYQIEVRAHPPLVETAYDPDAR